jgi:hypothetical protein
MVVNMLASTSSGKLVGCAWLRALYISTYIIGVSIKVVKLKSCRKLLEEHSGGF